MMTQLMINGDLPHQTIEQLRRFARLMDSNDSEQRLWSSLSQLDRDFVGNKIKIRYGHGRVAAIWQLARNTSAERAIVDAAYELGFMDAGMHRQLLTELGEYLVDIDDIAAVFPFADLIVVEGLQQAYFQGEEIPVDWGRYPKLWIYFVQLVTHAKAGEPLKSGAFGDKVQPDYHSKTRSRLVNLPGFPHQLDKLIETDGAGGQTIKISRQRIRIFRIVRQDVLVSDA